MLTQILDELTTALQSFDSEFNSMLDALPAAEREVAKKQQVGTAAAPETLAKEAQIIYACMECHNNALKRFQEVQIKIQGLEPLLYIIEEQIKGYEKAPNIAFSSDKKFNIVDISKLTAYREHLLIAAKVAAQATKRTARQQQAITSALLHNFREHEPQRSLTEQIANMSFDGFNWCLNTRIVPNAVPKQQLTYFMYHTKRMAFRQPSAYYTAKTALDKITREFQAYTLLEQDIQHLHPAFKSAFSSDLPDSRVIITRREAGWVRDNVQYSKPPLKPHWR